MQNLERLGLTKNPNVIDKEKGLGISTEAVDALHEVLVKDATVLPKLQRFGIFAIYADQEADPKLYTEKLKAAGRAHLGEFLVKKV